VSQPPCLNKALSGDRGALEELAGYCYPAVAGYLARRCGGEAARDLAQDVLVRVLESLDAYRPRPGAPFMAWVLRIARNRMIDAARSRHEQASLPEDGMEVSGIARDATGDAAFARLEAEGLRRALARLADRDRELLEFRYYYGFSHREAADILGVPPRVVKSRLNAALQRLRKQYLAMEGEGPDE
jgi:RNA polymerase sigma-70 factor (ECF subfamily)